MDEVLKKLGDLMGLWATCPSAKYCLMSGRLDCGACPVRPQGETVVDHIEDGTPFDAGDVLALRTQQLAPRMWVTESKTGKRKQVGLPKDLLERVRGQAGQVWAFPGRDPRKHRTRQAVWADVKRAAKAFRLPQNAGTHSMRKVYAVDLLDRYGDMERVRRALNHDRLETTLIYAMADRVLMAKRGGGKAGGVV